MTISEEQLQALQRDFRRVKLIKIGDVEFVIRAPKRHEYKAFRAKAMGDQKADATEDLCRLLVVCCNDVSGAGARPQFDAVLEDYPGLCESKAVARAVEQFVGMVADDVGKGSAPPATTNAGDPPRSPTA